MRAVLLLIFLTVALPVLTACAPFMTDVEDAYYGEPLPVVQAQRGLRALGYRPGPADGIMGPRTAQAVADYQSDRGLPVTGEVDGRFSAALRDDLDREGLLAELTREPPPPPPSEPKTEPPRDEEDPIVVLAPEPVPDPEAALRAGPLPDLVYQTSGHPEGLVAATGTPPEVLKDVRFSRVDLDGDGDLDAVWNITNPSYCGTAGCSFDIYFREGGGWRPVARLLAFEVDAGTDRSQGVRDLLVTGRRGSTLWRWTGSGYAPVG